MKAGALTSSHLGTQLVQSAMSVSTRKTRSGGPGTTACTWWKPWASAGENPDGQWMSGWLSAGSCIRLSLTLLLAPVAPGRAGGVSRGRAPVQDATIARAGTYVI
ncbi:hypothetical protein GCM10010345_43450 [Streptomyces canarius]|uniref:Uncharacterized protein n=1 Tax=Streptomyces canarius TaxID=285453 RepID=A0ABQ3CQ04_9ACTN|nr:hypothetical protein GCM10010345_43450 [Streptomyces canarius]